MEGSSSSLPLFPLIIILCLHPLLIFPLLLISIFLDGHLYCFSNPILLFLPLHFLIHVSLLLLLRYFFPYPSLPYFLLLAHLFFPFLLLNVCFLLLKILISPFDLSFSRLLSLLLFLNSFFIRRFLTIQHFLPPHSLLKSWILTYFCSLALSYSLLPSSLPISNKLGTLSSVYFPRESLLITPYFTFFYFHSN